MVIFNKPIGIREVDSVQRLPLFVVAAACLLAGFFVGRQLPVHHYQRFGEGPLLFDTATGKVCTIFRPDPSKNPFDVTGTEQNKGVYPVCGQ